MPAPAAVPEQADNHGPSSDSPSSPAPVLSHGGSVLPRVVVDAYNAELRGEQGFIGDRASRRAFRAMLEDWRDRLRAVGDDPFGERPSEAIGKGTLDRVLTEGDPEAAGVIHTAVEEFSQEFAGVIRRLLRLKAWRETQHILVGGGLRGGRVGELVIGRTAVLLKNERRGVTMAPVRHDPDEAGLVGCCQLAPSRLFAGHDCLLGVDIGGTNIRAGLVDLQLDRAPDLSRARVREKLLWRHGDDSPARDEAVERLVEMLRTLIRQAREGGQRLAPFIGVGCPGVIRKDGRIDRGGQNLPGNWESPGFNLPARLRAAIPEIGGRETTCVLHNDAVVHGLSEAPFMQEYERWAVLTIGTGLGNARFTNRGRPGEA